MACERCPEIGWHRWLMMSKTKFVQQMPQRLLLLKQRIKTIRSAIDKGFVVWVTHVEHLGDSMQDPEHGGRLGHEAQVG